MKADQGFDSLAKRAYYSASLSHQSTLSLNLISATSMVIPVDYLVYDQ